MARFSNGWIKLHRTVRESDLVDNPLLLALWTTLLMMATWRESKILWRGKQRHLPAGSVVFGIAELSSKWECSRSVIQKHLHHLHETGRIVLETCSRGTLVTICNWQAYQENETEVCSPSDNGVLTASSPRVHGEALIEEVRIKKEENTNGISPEKLEALYQLYPKRKNSKKSIGLSRLKRIITSPELYARIETSVRNYSAYVKQNVKEENFIKQFPTFVSEWEDWENVNCGPRSVIDFKTGESLSV